MDFDIFSMVPLPLVLIKGTFLVLWIVVLVYGSLVYWQHCSLNRARVQRSWKKSTLAMLLVSTIVFTVYELWSIFSVLNLMGETTALVVRVALFAGGYGLVLASLILRLMFWYEILTDFMSAVHGTIFTTIPYFLAYLISYTIAVVCGIWASVASADVFFHVAFGMATLLLCINSVGVSAFSRKIGKRFIAEFRKGELPSFQTSSGMLEADNAPPNLFLKRLHNYSIVFPLLFAGSFAANIIMIETGVSLYILEVTGFPLCSLCILAFLYVTFRAYRSFDAFERANNEVMAKQKRATMKAQREHRAKRKMDTLRVHANRGGSRENSISVSMSQQVDLSRFDTHSRSVSISMPADAIVAENPMPVPRPSVGLATNVSANNTSATNVSANNASATNVSIINAQISMPPSPGSSNPTTTPSTPI